MGLLTQEYREMATYLEDKLNPTGSILHPVVLGAKTESEAAAMVLFGTKYPRSFMVVTVITVNGVEFRIDYEVATNQVRDGVDDVLVGHIRAWIASNLATAILTYRVT